MSTDSKSGKVCQACLDDRHGDCELGPCACYQERKSVEREIARINNADNVYAEMVLSHVQYGGSIIAKLILDNAGRAETRLFVNQILRTAKALNC